MAVFESTQAKGGAAAGHVMVLSVADEDGKLTMYRASGEPLDRFVHVWGEAGPLVPVFFSMRGAVKFSMLEGYAVSDQGLSQAEGAVWAWTKLHEAPPPEASR